MMAVMERTREAYDAIFEMARQLEYPDVDAFEQRMGYAIQRPKLEELARVLACPLKANPPHWQHGRVIYAAVRRYLAEIQPSPVRQMLDIGTAKGFSALCMVGAVLDAGSGARVTSVDVIDPLARQARNTVAELDGVKTLDELLQPWSWAWQIDFRRATGVDWLSRNTERVYAAFIDGKHDSYVVRQEGKLLAQRQVSGDLAIFDDCQIPDVSVAVVSLGQWYRIEYVKAGPREYAIARRR